MTDRDLIHDYLKSLSKYLSRLNKADADEVIREIESHIYDALETSSSDSSAEDVLAGFGAPRDLAAGYVDHMLEGTPPPAGFRAIQKIKKGATKGIYLSTALFGFGFSAFFLCLGLYKLFAPSALKIWEADHGNSWIIGLDTQMPQGSTELLGYWVIPVAILFGLGSFYLTKRILSILKDKL